MSFDRKGVEMRKLPMERDYLIAGLRVRMDTYGRTEKQAAPYLIETAGEPDITIFSEPEKFHQKQPHLNLDDCEYLCTGGSFYRQLLCYDGLLVHASAVVKDGYAYLFSAPSGTGKSTHTNLWLKIFGNDVIMLNDDKPALRREPDGWYAYGTPWSGKTDQNANLRVPVGGVCMLSRGSNNVIKPFTGSRAAFALLEQTVRPATGGGREKLLGLLDDLMQNVPFWSLQCTPTEEAALVSQKTMCDEVNRRNKKGE